MKSLHTLIYICIMCLTSNAFAKTLYCQFGTIGVGYSYSNGYCKDDLLGYGGTSYDISIHGLGPQIGVSHTFNIYELTCNPASDSLKYYLSPEDLEGLYRGLGGKVAVMGGTTVGYFKNHKKEIECNLTSGTDGGLIAGVSYNWMNLTIERGRD